MTETSSTPLTATDASRISNKHFILVAYAGAPVMIAFALIGYSPVPILGWVLFAIGTVAVFFVATRSFRYFRNPDPRLRSLGMTTLPFAAMPVLIVGLLAIAGVLRF